MLPGKCSTAVLCWNTVYLEAGSVIVCVVSPSRGSFEDLSRVANIHKLCAGNENISQCNELLKGCSVFDIVFYGVLPAGCFFFCPERWQKAAAVLFVVCHKTVFPCFLSALLSKWVLFKVGRLPQGRSFSAPVNRQFVVPDMQCTSVIGKLKARLFSVSA